MIGLSGASRQRKMKGPALIWPVLLTAGMLQTITVALPAQADAITVSLKRPTTAKSVNWAAGSTCRVHATLIVDGVERRYSGQATGGIRLDGSSEIPAYQLRCTPTWGFFGVRTGFPKRLGETCTTYQLRIDLEWVSGTVDTELRVQTSKSQAPQVQFRSSVAFDAASSGSEVSGDGVVTVAHTSAGSNRGVFVGIGYWPVSGASTGVTYDGAAMTEKWDTAAGGISNAGYSLAGQSTTSSASVVSTMGATDPVIQVVGVVSMTGVDQSIPTGSAFEATGSGANPSVTVTDAVTGDLVCDNLISVGFGTPSPDAGQTQTYAVDLVGSANRRVHGSRQAGADGGVMSWTLGATDWRIGAIAFKAAAAGGVTYPQLERGIRGVNRGVVMGSYR